MLSHELLYRHETIRQTSDHLPDTLAAMLSVQPKVRKGTQK